MRKFKAVFSMILVILLMSTSTIFAAPKESITYTALGDSIASGTGSTNGQGYAGLLNDHLNKKYNGEVSYLNLSQNGLTSFQMLEALNNPQIQQTIANSDIVTISIGGNDLLNPFLIGFQEVITINYFNPQTSTIDYARLNADLEQWQKDPLNPKYSHFNELLGKLSAWDFPIALGGFAINWTQTISQIRAINPDADIYVNTVYNPFVNIPILKELMNDFITTGLNASIKDENLIAQYNYKVVDVYSKFSEYGNPKKLAVGDLSNLAECLQDPDTVPVPLHPTEVSYKFIFNLHKDLMK